MTKLTIHGGDFRKGPGWFYSAGFFMLHNKHGRQESIPLVLTKAVDHASTHSLSMFGGGETLRADFERTIAEDEVREQIFLASFDDGRLLLSLAEAFGNDVGGGRILVRQKVTQSDLAAMGGLARENVSRILKDWTDRSLVSRLAGYYCLENKAAIEREVSI